MFRGLLAERLGTEIFMAKKIVLCHACHNAKCSNTDHLYWGSYTDNIDDQKENGTWKNVWERTVDKYGYEEACKMQRLGDKSAGGRAGKGKTLSAEHKRKISETLSAKDYTRGKSTGRKRETDPDTLLALVKEFGFKGAAEQLDISLSALKGRYYRL